jgi:predicted DCC family thiol-disulfide oxidoreductase YuxK
MGAWHRSPSPFPHVCQVEAHVPGHSKSAAHPRKMRVMSSDPAPLTTSKRSAADPRAVILYDGECGLCDRLVQFVLPRDPRGYFRFAALQSEYARRALAVAGMPTEDFDTMVLIESGKVYVRSSAALRVLRRLRQPWPIFFSFIIVPAFVRDLVYRFIARNRHRWFPRPESCGLPKPGWTERFID